jgi:hypothetical protein
LNFRLTGSGKMKSCRREERPMLKIFTLFYQVLRKIMGTFIPRLTHSNSL